jgi:hypothetical protein
VTSAKQALLDALREIWITASIISTTIDRIEEMDDSVAIVRPVAATFREMREEFGDIARRVLATAAHKRGAPLTNRNNGRPCGVSAMLRQ